MFVMAFFDVKQMYDVRCTVYDVGLWNEDAL